MTSTDDSTPTEDTADLPAGGVKETFIGPPQDPVGPVLRTSIVILALLAVIYTITIARVFVVPIILALLLALVFSPLCRWLSRRRVPEAASAALVVLSVVVMVVVLTALLAAPVTGWIEDAPYLARQFEIKMRVLSGVAEAVSEASEQVQDMTGPDQSDPDAPVEVIVQEQGPLTAVALGAPLIVAQTAFVLILLYFILASGPMFYDRLVSVMPTFADKKRAMKIARDIEREVSRYLLTITAINAGLGIAVAIAFTILDMPNPLVFGFLAFALNYVPFIGAIMGTALAFVVAIVTKDTAGAAFLVAFVFWALTAIEGQFVTPMAVGRRLKLNTVVILISVAFWAWIWSVMGMLMAVPLLVTLRVFCEHIPSLATLGAFLSGRGSDKPGAS